MALSQYTVDLLIKKNTNESRELLIDLLRNEKKSLQGKQARIRKIAKEQDIDLIMITDTSRYTDISKDIKTVNSLIKQLQAKQKDSSKHVQSYRLLNLAKKQKAQIQKKQISIREFVKITETEKINDVVRNMFYKGNFAGLSESTIQKYDSLLKKFGFNLTDDIKGEIKKEYKNWGSDTAILSMANLINNYREKIKLEYDSSILSDEEQQEVLQLINELKSLTGV